MSSFTLQTAQGGFELGANYIYARQHIKKPSATLWLFDKLLSDRATEIGKTFIIIESLPISSND